MDVFEKINVFNMECMDVIIALDGVRHLVNLKYEEGCILSAQMMLEMLQEKLVHATDGIDDIVKACQSAGGDKK